jgi:hypothetical protein
MYNIMIHSGGKKEKEIRKAGHMQNNLVTSRPGPSQASEFLAHLVLQFTDNGAMRPVQTIAKALECSLERSGVTTRSVHSPDSLSPKLVFSPHRFSHVQKGNKTRCHLMRQCVVSFQLPLPATKSYALHVT